MINVDDDTSQEEAMSLLVEIGERVKAGEKFLDLVKEYSEDEGTKDTGGELGTTDGSVFPPEFEKALEEMTEGQISKHIKLEDSLHLLMLTKIQKPTPDTYKNKRETILSNLKEDLSNTEFVELLDQASDLTFSLNDLDSVSKELALPIKSTPYFSQGDAPSDLNQIKILDLLFKNEEFQNNPGLEILELEDGHAIILSLENYQSEKIKSFNQVEQEAKNLYKLQLAQLEADQLASNVIEKLNQGLDLSTIAKDNGIELENYKSLSRNTSLLSSSVILDIFNLSRSNLNNAFGASSLDNGDVIIYKLNAINEKESEITKEDVESFKGFINEERKISEQTELQLASQESRKIVRKY